MSKAKRRKQHAALCAFLRLCTKRIFILKGRRFRWKNIFSLEEHKWEHGAIVRGGNVHGSAFTAEEARAHR